jgi:3-methyladenine DNA glycosylase AlkD
METNELHEQIRQIKEQFRLSMNGPVSASMREKGVAYKVNFGVEIPRIRAIAQPYGLNHALAQALWKEDVRECKLMAAMVQPVDTFFPDIADIWIEQMHVEELAAHTTLNLFQRLPYASEAAFRWMADDREMFQLCGFLLITRLFINGGRLNERSEAEYLDQAQAATHSPYATVRRAAQASLTRHEEQKQQAE